MPKLSRITIYPIRLLNGVSVQSAMVASGGTLAHDREYALFDSDANIVNAKRTAKIHLIRAKFVKTSSPFRLHFEVKKHALN